MLQNDHEAGIIVFTCARNLQYLCNKVRNEVWLVEHLNVAQSTFSKCTIVMAYAMGSTLL